MSSSLHEVQSEILLAVVQVTEQDLGDGLKVALSSCKSLESISQETDRGHYVGTDINLLQVELRQRLEGEEVKLELVHDQVVTGANGLVRPENVETVQVTAGVNNVGEVQPLVLSVEWRTGTPQSLTDGVELERTPPRLLPGCRGLTVLRLILARP